MDVTLNPKVSYTSRSQERKDAEKKVVTGTGAVAAATSAANVKATKSGFDMFTSASKITKGMKTSTEATKIIGETVQKSKGVWSRASEASKWVKDWIIKGGSKFKNVKFIKPLINNKAFKFCAGGVGYICGAATLVSGLSDIGKATTNAVENRLIT